MERSAAVGKRSLAFASGVMVSRATGYIRDLIMAAVFGSHPSVAAFLIAFRLVNLPRRILGEGAMHAAYIPTYEALRREHPLQALRFTRDLSLLVTAAAAILTLVGELICLSSLGEVARLTAYLLPSLIALSAFGLMCAFLNCHGRYFRPGVAPALINITWILALLAFRGWLPAAAMRGMALALTLAFGLQALFVLAPSLRLLKPALSSPLRLRATGSRIWKPLSLSLIGVGAAQVNAALDTLFASAADPRGPAFLWYAIRLQQLPLALVGIALFSALLPSLSRAAKKEDGQEYRALLRFGISRSAAVLLPVTLAVLCFAPFIVQVTYARGAFTALDVLSTAQPLRCYILGLWPMSLSLILNAGLQARSAHRYVGIVSLIAVAVNATLNATCVFLFHLGPASIALATTLASILQSLLLLRRTLGPRGVLDLAVVSQEVADQMEVDE